MSSSLLFSRCVPFKIWTGSNTRLPLFSSLRLRLFFYPASSKGGKDYQYLFIKGIKRQ
ncbi:MAG: hypothetical protein ACYCYP_06435 [Leptospirales bacterium]